MRETILGWIERDRDALVAFLSEFVRVPSPNPPGDTRVAAAFLHDQLRAHGVPVEYRTAKPEWPNVVGSFTGTGPAAAPISSSTGTSMSSRLDRPRAGRAIPGAVRWKAARCTAAAWST